MEAISNLGSSPACPRAQPAMSSRIAASSQGEPPASSQAEAPTQLSGEDRYCRLDEGAGLGAVARGAFAKVYMAVDRSRESTVVVKRQEMPSDVAVRELAYYKALSSFPHPNVMPLLDYFTKSLDLNSRCNQQKAEKTNTASKRKQPEPKRLKAADAKHRRGRGCQAEG